MLAFLDLDLSLDRLSLLRPPARPGRRRASRALPGRFRDAAPPRIR